MSLELLTIGYQKSLSKEELRKLQRRTHFSKGEKLILGVSGLEGQVYAVTIYQRRSQKFPALPEGYLLLESALYKTKRFRYDFCKGRIQVRHYEAYCGKIQPSWHCVEAKAYYWRPGTPELAGYRRRAYETEVRESLLRELTKDRSLTQDVCELMADDLKVRRNEITDHARFNLAWIWFIEIEVIQSLLSAIKETGASSIQHSSLSVAA